MNNITLIIIGTIHETEKERHVFDYINNVIKNNLFPRCVWLCEGESLDRQCVSLKNNGLHLLTDALFVNMMIRDLTKSNFSDSELINNFYERIIELYMTISKSKYKKIITEKFSQIKCIQMLNDVDIMHNYDKYIKCLSSNLLSTIEQHRQLVKYIVELSQNVNNFSKLENECINIFYDGENKYCENHIMTRMREKSFVSIMKSFIYHALNKYSRIIVTVGSDHVVPLFNFFSQFINKIYKIIV